MRHVAAPVAPRCRYMRPLPQNGEMLGQAHYSLQGDAPTDSLKDDSCENFALSLPADMAFVCSSSLAPRAMTAEMLRIDSGRLNRATIVSSVSFCAYLRPMRARPVRVTHCG